MLHVYRAACSVKPGSVPDQVPDALKEMLGPDAPDVCIEAVGFHYMNSWLHKVENALLLETDTSEILNELIYCCRKVMRLCCISTSPESSCQNISASLRPAIARKPLCTDDAIIIIAWHVLTVHVVGQI